MVDDTLGWAIDSLGWNVMGEAAERALIGLQVPGFITGPANARAVNAERQKKLRTAIEWLSKQYKALLWHDALRWDGKKMVPRPALVGQAELDKALRVAYRRWYYLRQELNEKPKLTDSDWAAYWKEVDVYEGLRARVAELAEPIQQLQKARGASEIKLTKTAPPDKTPPPDKTGFDYATIGFMTAMGAGFAAWLWTRSKGRAPS